MEGRNGLLPLLMTPADAAAEFPAASGWLGAQRIAALAASSYLVGMITPGLHSVYGELAFQTCSALEPANALAYCVARSVPRFLSIDLQIAGAGITGLVKGLVRPAPVRQAAMGTLAGLVGAAEFASSLTLIAGGSRGLGELTAKLIAAGGGRVIITWQSGCEDAERVAAEIRASGGVCETLQYDARKSADAQLAALAEGPTHAYYFATPLIGRSAGEVFSSGRWRDFQAVYVDGFWQFAQALRTRRSNLTLFYPSSVFATERPEGMTEYTMAKAAGEVLCADMNASLHPLRVVVSRLPRLPTDQTAGLAESETASPIEIMLQVVRKVQATRQN
jgi:NAD(P)-dependent dehydrogenase (short-subunit alcohol dehydrogenase family)